MKPTSKTIKAEAIKNVRAWLVGRPVEEILELVTPRGQYAMEDSYIRLARIVSGRRAGRKNLLGYAYAEVIQELTGAVRSRRLSAGAASKRRSEINRRNAKKPRGSKRYNKKDLREATELVREKRRSGWTWQTACEEATEKHTLGISWTTLYAHINKRARKK